MFKQLSAAILFSVCWCWPHSSARAWDYEGHRLVNQLALSTLSTNFPAFVQTPAARERIAFLAGEADRWRNSNERPLRHVNAPDHFIDLDDLTLYHLEPGTLPAFRYDFVNLMATQRATRPADFPAQDKSEDADHTRGLPGFLPWTVAEYYGKLKSACAYLKAYEQAGTPEEIENAQQNIIYLMGVMGHFVGDASQPLHTTRHYNGWVGENPQGFTTSRNFHAWIDGGYLRKAGLDREKLTASLRPAQLLWTSDPKSKELFSAMVRFIDEQHQLVVPLYQLEKDGQLPHEGEAQAEGRDFLTRQLAKAGQMLGDIWLTAWQEAPVDVYLKGQLNRRQLNSK